MKPKLRNKMLPLIIYIIAWFICVLAYWLGAWKEPMGYGVVFLFMILPVATFIVSIALGQDSRWGVWSWVMCLLFGAMHAAAGRITYDLSSMMVDGVIPKAQLDTIPLMTCVAIAGVAIGKITARIKSGRGDARQR